MIFLLDTCSHFVLFNYLLMFLHREYLEILPDSKNTLWVRFILLNNDYLLDYEHFLILAAVAAL